MLWGSIHTEGLVSKLLYWSAKFFGLHSQNCCCKLVGGMGFFTIIYPSCKEFFRVSCFVVCSCYFSDVYDCSLVNEGINVWNATKQTSYFLVFYVLFSDIIPLYSEDSSYCSMMETASLCRLFFVRFHDSQPQRRGLRGPATYMDLIFSSTSSLSRNVLWLPLMTWLFLF